MGRYLFKNILIFNKENIFHVSDIRNGNMLFVQEMEVCSINIYVFNVDILFLDNFPFKCYHNFE